MIQNVIIGKPMVEPWHFFAFDEADWKNLEIRNTLITTERFLPRILVSAGIAKSTSEVRKNRPELFIELTSPTFLKIKWGKKFLWILVGE